MSLRLPPRAPDPFDCTTSRRSYRRAHIPPLQAHNVVLEWLVTLLHAAIRDGRLCGGPVGALPAPTSLQLQSKVTELRATYGAIDDELSGRMPLACGHHWSSNHACSFEPSMPVR